MLAGEDFIDSAPQCWSQQRKKTNRYQQGHASVAAAALLIFAEVQCGFADGAACALGDGQACAGVEAGERLDQFGVGGRLRASLREISSD